MSPAKARQHLCWCTLNKCKSDMKTWKQCSKWNLTNHPVLYRYFCYCLKGYWCSASCTSNHVSPEMASKHQGRSLAGSCQTYSWHGTEWPCWVHNILLRHNTTCSDRVPSAPQRRNRPEWRWWGLTWWWWCWWRTYPGSLVEEDCPCRLASRFHWETSWADPLWAPRRPLPDRGPSLWTGRRSATWRPRVHSEGHRLGHCSPSWAPAWWGSDGGTGCCRESWGGGPAVGSTGCHRQTFRNHCRLLGWMRREEPGVEGSGLGHLPPSTWLRTARSASGKAGGHGPKPEGGIPVKGRFKKSVPGAAAVEEASAKQHQGSQSSPRAIFSQR